MYGYVEYQYGYMEDWQAEFVARGVEELFEAYDGDASIGKLASALKKD